MSSCLLCEVAYYWIMSLFILHFRNNFNSPGVMSAINRSLKESSARVYLLLIETKLKALRNLTAVSTMDASVHSSAVVSTRREPEVSQVIIC